MNMYCPSHGFCPHTGGGCVVCRGCEPLPGERAAGEETTLTGAERVTLERVGEWYEAQKTLRSSDGVGSWEMFGMMSRAEEGLFKAAADLYGTKGGE